MTGISTTALPRFLSNFRALRSSYHPISRLRDFARFGGKTSCRFVNRGPELIGSSALRYDMHDLYMLYTKQTMNALHAHLYDHRFYKILSLPRVGTNENAALILVALVVRARYSLEWLSLHLYIAILHGNRTELFGNHVELRTVWHLHKMSF